MTLDLLGVYAAGLFTVATPCVLPLVPIYLAALVGTDIRKLDSAGRFQLLIRGGFFSLGFIFVFTMLGLGASSIGAVLAEHKTAAQIGGAVLIGLFGLKFLGIIQLPWLDRTVRASGGKFQGGLGVFNALVMGIVFAVGWSPCVGPVLGSVLTYTASATSDPLVGAGYLALYGLGFATPLFGLAIFAQAGTRLLRLMSAHLRKVELAIGTIMILVASIMIFDALPSSSANQAPAQVSGEEAIAMTDQRKTADNKPSLLMFTSEDCTICQRMKPVINNLSEQCDGKKVQVRKVDLSRSENLALARKYRLVGVPTFVFVDSEEREVARLVGEQTDGTLRRALSALRGEPCPGMALFNPQGNHSHENETSVEDPQAGSECALGDLGGQSQLQQSCNDT